MDLASRNFVQLNWVLRKPHTAGCKTPFQGAVDYEDWGCVWGVQQSERVHSWLRTAARHWEQASRVNYHHQPPASGLSLYHCKHQFASLRGLHFLQLVRGRKGSHTLLCLELAGTQRDSGRQRAGVRQGGNAQAPGRKYGLVWGRAGNRLYFIITTLQLATNLGKNSNKVQRIILYIRWILNGEFCLEPCFSNHPSGTPEAPCFLLPPISPGTGRAQTHCLGVPEHWVWAPALITAI